jgi:hypothetical protein
VSVTLDGQELTSKLDGKALFVDPGVHEFGFALDGQLPINRQLLIRQGEKNRVLEVSWYRPPEEVPPPEPGVLRPYSYALLGIGIGGVLGFAVLGTIGRQEERDLFKACGDVGCVGREAEINDAERKQLLADVSLGVGAAALITGATFFFLSQPDDEATATEAVRLDWQPRTGGGLATMSGAF